MKLCLFNILIISLIENLDIISIKTDLYLMLSGLRSSVLLINAEMQTIKLHFNAVERKWCFYSPQKNSEV